MKEGVEILAASAVASLLALGLVPVPQSAGVSSAGNDGESTVSVQAASASVSAMVTTWEAPPEVIETVAAPAPPPIVAPPVVQPQTPVQRPLPMLAPPAMPQATTPNPTETNTAPPEPIRAPKTSPRPPARPNPVAQPAPPAAAPSTPSAPRAEQRAAGSGQSATAGQSTARETATLSASQRASLMSQWGGQIQNRIARRAPRGAGKGTAVVRLSVTGTGALAGVSLAQSSGNPQIDQLAIQAVRAAGTFPAAPKGLGSGPFSFSIPIRSQ